MIKLEVADEFNARELVIGAALPIGRLHLLFKNAHYLFSFLRAQVFELSHANPIGKLIHKSLNIELLLTEVINEEVNVLELVALENFFLHQRQYSQRKSYDHNDSFDKEEVPHDKVDLLRQIDRKQTGDPLESDQVEAEHVLLEVLAEAWQALEHVIL